MTWFCYEDSGYKHIPGMLRGGSRSCSRQTCGPRRWSFPPTSTTLCGSVPRSSTTQNHLSVIELGEPVTQVAAGSSSFKIEWRENKVFIQPLEPDATTNLFIWTASGRLSYELVPASSVEEMHFAIDQDPPAIQAKKEDPVEQAPDRSATYDTCGHADGEHARQIGWIFKKPPESGDRGAGRLPEGWPYLPSVCHRQRSRTVYLPAAPEVFTLNSPRAPQSLIPLANSQLAGDYQLKWKDEARVPVVHTELQAPVVLPEKPPTA